MDLATCHPVFLVFACFQAVALTVYVEPPTNVTLDCHNMNNTVKWSYGQFSDELKFIVDVRALSGFSDEILVEPPTLQADVSFLSDPDDDYWIIVRAVIGQNESEKAPPDGIIFSYFQDSPANQKCFVDFPPVNVTAQKDGEVLFHFEHPWLLYHHNLTPKSHTKSRKKKSRNAQTLPEFKYDVIINQKPPHSFSCEQSLCKGTLVTDASLSKHCLKVTGEMKKMSVQASQEYCALPVDTTKHDRNKSIYIFIGVVVLLASVTVAFVLFMVFKKKTKPSTSLPRSMTFTSRLRERLQGAVHVPILVPVSAANTAPTSPTQKEGESGEFPRTPLPSTELDLRLPIGLLAEEEGLCDDVDDDEGAVCTQSSSSDREEPQVPRGASSGYETRPVLVWMGAGDVAQGYRA